MTQKEKDEKFNELRISLVEAEKQIQDIRKELDELDDELDKVQIEPESRRWKPKRGQTYYCITSDGEIVSNTWNEGCYDLLRFTIGNCFETREEAEFVVERLKVIAELKEFAEPDGSPWDSNAGQFNIIYNHNEIDVCVEHWTYIQTDSIYFKSRERALEAIKAVGKDRIKKYYLRVKEDKE